MVKLLMSILLTSLSSFYESQLQMTQFGFCSDQGCNEGIRHQTSSSNKLHTPLIGNYITVMSTSPQHMTILIDFFSSIRNHLLNSESTDLIEELYQCTKLYISSEDPNMQTFQNSSGVQEEANESSNLSFSRLCLCGYRSTDMMRWALTI